MVKKQITYAEGQWFALPLLNGGYSLGLIIRGSYKTKAVLGYFWGPKYVNIPNDINIKEKSKNDAILVAWFGDLGIVNGRWPLINSTRTFSRIDWPVPYFSRNSPLTPGKGFLVEYDQQEPIFGAPIRETLLNISELKDLPIDQLSGYGVIEIKISKLLHASVESS